MRWCAAVKVLHVMVCCFVREGAACDGVLKVLYQLRQLIEDALFSAPLPGFLQSKWVNTLSNTMRNALCNTLSNTLSMTLCNMPLVGLSGCWVDWVLG